MDYHKSNKKARKPVRSAAAQQGNGEKTTWQNVYF
jgi:hypothetical protein